MHVSNRFLIFIQFAFCAAVAVAADSSLVRTLPEPLAPAQRKAGPCVLRYIESEPDDHLDLQIKTVNGQILLSDVAKTNLRSCTYTLNGWTDPEDASKLVNEPIEPYTVYHLAKASIAAPMREWWRSMPEIRKNAPIDVRRSELFFVVIPEGETWNGVGQGVNPVGRPLAFSKLPPFKLTNRVYGFEANFADETSKRLDELDITFNRKPGKKHVMSYSGPLENFIKSKGYDKEPRKPVQSWNEQDCIDFANSLPGELILAFDVEPPSGWHWMLDYDHPNYVTNMSRVINRLNQRGIKGYDWMHGVRFAFGADELQGFKHWGNGNDKMDVYLNAYAHPGQITKKHTANRVINLGFGYDPYDINFLPGDAGNRNSGPQATWLKELDACELASRVFPDCDLLAFAWAYMEFDLGEFPRNHVVQIPTHNAVARRTDNKPLYPPSAWQDNLTLALLYCNYMFYWSPGDIGWDPARTARYAKGNLLPGELEIWLVTKGNVPPVTGACYAGKESLIYNSTITAAYRYSQIQDICDTGKRHAVATTFRRAGRDGNLGPAATYPAYPDGSQFVQAAKNRQPFTLVVKNPKTNRKVVFFQDVWSRPGRCTEFSFDFEGKTYKQMKNADGKVVPLRTQGNRLLIGLLD